MSSFRRLSQIPIFRTFGYEKLLKSLSRKKPSVAYKKQIEKSIALHSDIVMSAAHGLQNVFNTVLSRQSVPSCANPFWKCVKTSSILLTDAHSMQALNLRHKSKDRPTDCICFPSLFTDCDIVSDPESKIEERCRFLHTRLSQGSKLHVHITGNSRESNLFEFPAIPEKINSEDLGIIALCPSYILERCIRAIGTSRLSLGRPVRTLIDLRIACRMRARCVGIHAGLHMLGFTHFEGKPNDSLKEDLLMKSLEKRAYKHLYEY